MAAVATATAPVPAPQGKQSSLVPQPAEEALVTAVAPRSTEAARGSGTAAAASPSPPTLPRLQAIGQAGARYILAEAADGIYLVDQHAAHERIIYERLRQTPPAQPLALQTLAAPVRVDLPPALRPLLEGHRAQLAGWGFGLAVGEDGALQVTAVPAGLRADAVGPVLEELGTQLRAAGGTPPADWREQALTTIACHSAIRAGQPLSLAEMQVVLADLAQCARP